MSTAPWRRAASLALLAGVSACPDIAGFDGSPQMDPGQDCLVCHGPGGSAAALAFAVGGTVFSGANSADDQGLFNAQIELTEALADGGSGRTVVLSSNGAGNFYTAETLHPPFAVAVTVPGSAPDLKFRMNQLAPSGACNACHALLANGDGTQQSAPLSAVAIDAGYARPPGHLYGFAADGGCPPPPSGCPTGQPVPSYRREVQAAIEGNCYPCHGSAAASDPLLTSPAAFGGTVALSCLSQIGRCNMPLGYLGPMSPGQRRLLLDWLACGAPDN